MVAPVLRTTVGPLTGRISTFQPSSRLPPLLNFARIFLPIKYTFSYSKIGRNKLHPFSKISVDVLSLLDFKVCLQSQLLNFFITKVLFGWCGCQLFWIHGSCLRSHGLLPMAISIGVLPLRVACVFHTVAALRINWAGVLCDRVVSSRFSEAVSTSAERNFLNNRTPISAQFGHVVCGPVRSLFTLCIR